MDEEMTWENYLAAAMAFVCLGIVIVLILSALPQCWAGR